MARSRAIRIFVSSTFHGMQAERERLVKFAFPEIRRRCRDRKLEFLDVDLRWGITDEQQAEVLPICMHEIDLCRPYFIGVLGNQYGTVLPALPAALVTKHPWLAGLAEASVTEIEIRYGALNEPRAATHAFFYFRAANQLEDGNGPATNLDRRLIRLCDAVRASGFSVREEYPDAATLGDWVVDDLWRAIDAEFPADPSRDELDRITEEHEAFGAALTTTYVVRPGLFEHLDAHAEGRAPPLIVVGGVGAGKTALLANWVARRRSVYPDEFLVAHFTGCTPESTELGAMLQRVIAAIARRHNLPGRLPESDREVRDEFPRWLSAAAERGRMVLVLDGLDQLESETDLDLGWLPLEPPPGICLILSLRDTRSISPSIAQERLARRAWTTLELQPLHATEMSALATQFLRRHGKTLTTAQLTAITRRAPASNPLFLSVLLEDLRVFWSYELLDRQLAHYLEAPDAEHLYGLVLERLDADYAERHGGLVRLTLSLLWAARRGLSEAELTLLLATGHGTHAEALPQAVWSPLRYALGGALVSRAGLLGFAHEELRRAVEKRYLADQDTRRANHRRLGNFFTLILFRDTLPGMIASDLSFSAEHSQVLHRLLAAEGMTRDERARVELPWQWEQAAEWWRLRVALTHPRIVGSLYDWDSRRQLGRYWRALAERYDVVAAYDEFLVQCEKWSPPDQYGWALGAVGSLLCDLGRYAAAERMLAQAVESLERCRVEPIELWMTLGNLYEEINRHDQARVWHERALAGLEKLFGTDSHETSGALKALGVDYQHLDNLERAASLLERAHDIESGRFGAESYMLAEALAILGGVRQDEGKYGEARELLERALSLFERRYGSTHYAVAAVIQNLGDLDRQAGNYELALERFRQVAAMLKETLGRTHRFYAACLSKQAEALEGLEAYAEAIPLLWEAFAIRLALYGAGAPVVIDCVVRIIDDQMAQGDFEAARAEVKQALAELEPLVDVPERSLERLRARLSNIDDILGYDPL